MNACCAWKERWDCMSESVSGEREGGSRWSVPEVCECYEWAGSNITRERAAAVKFFCPNCTVPYTCVGVCNLVTREDDVSACVCVRCVCTLYSPATLCIHPYRLLIRYPQVWQVIEKEERQNGRWKICQSIDIRVFCFVVILTVGQGSRGASARGIILCLRCLERREEKESGFPCQLFSASIHSWIHIFMCLPMNSCVYSVY